MLPALIQMRLQHDSFACGRQQQAVFPVIWVALVCLDRSQKLTAGTHLVPSSSQKPTPSTGEPIPSPTGARQAVRGLKALTSRGVPHETLVAVNGFGLAGG